MPGAKALHGPPYPYDAVISGQPVMLAPGPNGQAAWNERNIKLFADAVQLTAEDRGYQQWPPEVELPYAVTDLSEGAGIAEQNPKFRHRYHYTLFADASSGDAVKGPLFNDQQTLTLSGSTPTQIIEFNSKLYLISGPLMFRRDDETSSGWVAVTVPAGFTGKTLGKCVVYRGTNSANLLFIPVGTGSGYYVMNAAETFTLHAAGQTAQHFEVRADELWLITTESNQVLIRKSTDGGTAATWGGASFVVMGDGAHAPTWLKTVADRLMIVKEDGIFQPDTNEISAASQELTPALRPLAATNNGRGAITWNNELVFTFASLLYKYDPTSGNLMQFGPETLEQNGSEVKGPVQSISAQEGMALYAGLYNSTNGHSYLAKYGAWRMEQTPNGPVRNFLPVWHMALYKWSSKQVALVHVTNQISGGPRLYVVFTSGNVQWCVLPSTMVASDDPNYRFDTANTGEVYYPRFKAGFPFEPKLLKGVGLSGRSLSTGARTIGAAYKAAVDTSYTTIGSTATDPGERIEPSGSPVANGFDIKATLTTTSSSATPILNTFVVYSQLRTNTTGLRDITMLVNVANKVTDRLDRPMRISWQELLAAIEGVMETQGSVSVITPKGETITVTGIDYDEAMQSIDKDGARTWTVAIHMIQTKVTFSRGTWARAGAYDWASLGAFKWGEVSSL